MSIFPTTLAPPDPIFHLTASFKKSSVANKINLGVGAYRDDSGNPWVLPVVRKAELLIVNNPALDHEYLPIDGLPAFTHASVKLMLGDSNDKVAAAQTISGTGAVRLGADFLKRFCPADVYIPDPTWGNHKAIFGDAGLKVISYPYWDPTTKGLDFVGMIECLNKAAPKSIILFHPCAHNPTGVDPSQEQWKELASLCQTRNLVPFFDSAYQGFATTLDQDAWAVRYFVSQGIELLFCQSYSKNFGLYNERCGCLAVVTISTDKAKEVSSQLCKLIRAGYSNPPAFGARIVSLVLNTPELAAEW